MGVKLETLPFLKTKQVTMSSLLNLLLVVYNSRVIYNQLTYLYNDKLVFHLDLPFEFPEKGLLILGFLGYLFEGYRGLHSRSRVKNLV